MNNLNDIQLPSQVLADLYTTSLVGAGDPEVPWKFLGNNRQQVLVVVQVPGVTHLPDDQLELLTRLLQACGMDLGDVAILNHTHYKALPYTRILEYFHPRILLLFGLSTEAFGFPFEVPAYQVQSFTDYTVIHGPALDALADDKEAKGLLWAGLKKIFKL